MSLLTHQHESPVASTASALKTKGRRHKTTTTIQCLVLSDCPARREMLANAAVRAGWDAVICTQPETAWSAVQRQRFEMALVDLDGASNAESFRELAEHLGSTQQSLLMVCGEEGNALEEIWARQLGAWLYLPGVSDESDIAALCEEAVPVVEKLTGRRASGAFA